VIAGLYGPEVAAQTDLARLALWGEHRTDPLAAALFTNAAPTPSAPSLQATTGAVAPP
jgi:hypothetical protein